MKILVSAKTFNIELAPHTASNFLDAENEAVRQMAEILNEVGDDFLNYACVERGNILSDDGLVIENADTLSYDDGLKPLAEIVASAEGWESDGYQFSQAILWSRSAAGETAPVHILFFMEA